MREVCGRNGCIGSDTRMCVLNVDHDGAHAYARPKPTKKERIAELEYTLSKRDRKIENLLANERGSIESHRAKNARIAELEEELAHQLGKVERSQERHARRTERENELSRKISELEVERIELMRQRDVAQGTRNAALSELRVERRQHDDTKEVVTALRNSIGELEILRDSLRDDVEIAEERAIGLSADVAYWQDRVREGLHGASLPSIFAEISRRISEK